MLDLDRFKNINDTFRHLVGDTPFDIEGQSLPVSVSLGVAVIASDAVDLTSALKQADEALYQAKYRPQPGLQHRSLPESVRGEA